MIHPPITKHSRKKRTRQFYVCEVAVKLEITIYLTKVDRLSTFVTFPHSNPVTKKTSGTIENLKMRKN